VLDAAAFAAVAVVFGGVVAVTARDGRIVVLGLMLAAVAASLVTSPLPSSLAVSARILGAMLAAYLLWAAAGSRSVDSAGSAIGLVAEGAVALAAFAVGLAVAPVDPLAGPAEAQAAGLSMIALAVVPLAGRDVFRMGVGVTLLTLGGSLLVGAWTGPAFPLGQLAIAALLVGIAGATSLLIPSAEEAAAVEAAAVEAAAVEAGAEGAAEGAETEPQAAQLETAARRAATTRGQAFQVIVNPGSAAVDDSAPVRSIEPERRPRPMTADPIEPDDWLAWGAPAPEPVHRAATRTGRRPPAPTPAPTPAEKPAPKKPTRSRPNLRGKP
jgi:hypothetical protein